MSKDSSINWQAILNELKQKMPKATYNNLLLGSTIEINQTELTIQVQNKNACEWLKNRLATTIKNTIKAMTGQDMELIFISPQTTLTTMPITMPMQNQQTQIQQVRIYSHITPKNFLHIEDALETGKVRLLAGEKKHETTYYCTHYIDLPDARVILKTISKTGFTYKEEKDSILTIIGNPTNTTITLTQTATTIYFALTKHEANRLGETVLAYIHAWDTLRMIHYQNQIKIPPYTVKSPIKPLR